MRTGGLTNSHFSQSQYMLKLGIAIGYGPMTRVRFPAKVIFVFTTAFRPSVGFTHPPVQWITGVSSLGIKWEGSDADHYHRLVLGMRISGATLLPPIRFHGMVLKCGTTLYLPPVIVNRGY